MTQSNPKTYLPDTAPGAWAGLVLPGLGHILMRRYLDGIGLICLSGCVLWALTGISRGLDLIRPFGDPQFLAHPWVAMSSLVLIIVFLWRTAFRLAQPLPVDVELEKTSQLRIMWKQFRKNGTGVLGMYMVSILITLALLTPCIAPFDPDQIDVGEKLLSPASLYLMGTDEFGRDLFSRIMYGARISLTIGFLAVGLSATIGTLVGATAGYLGGVVDRTLMWFTDLLLSFPRLILLMTIVGFFRAAGAQTIYLIVTILGITGWMGIARIVRSQVLSLKEQDFIQATRALGLHPWRIILYHLVPNALAPVIVFASLAVGGMILVEAGLSFLGLGVPPPTATWGSIVNGGREYLRSAWWISLFPGLMIVFAVMSFNLFGDGIRDALDPKLRGRK
jgi:peptide/nickel transport system permease protein